MSEGQRPTVDQLSEEVLLKDIIRCLGDDSRQEVQSLRDISTYMQQLPVRQPPSEKELADAIFILVKYGYVALSLTNAGKNAFRGQSR